MVKLLGLFRTFENGTRAEEASGRESSDYLDSMLVLYTEAFPSTVDAGLQGTRVSARLYSTCERMNFSAESKYMRNKARLTEREERRERNNEEIIPTKPPIYG